MQNHLATTADGPLTIGMDIGGTNLRAAVIDADGVILDVEKLPTPSETVALESAIVQVVELLRRRHPRVAAVGMAIAGFLTPDVRTVRFAPHLPWRNANVAARLERQVGLPVVLEHDANAAAWGEYRRGAAQGVGTWSLFAVGTGIGGALMIDGKLYRGAYGTAPEFGHLTVVPDGRSCPCGKRGCLERYCSGSALQLSAQDRIVLGGYPESELSRRFHGCAEEISGRHIVRAARHGDALALDVMADFAQWLGRGLAMVQDVLDPELIVLGGGVSADADLYLNDALDVFAREVVGAGHRPISRVETAVLGGDAGMIGVALLAAERIRAHATHSE